MWSCRCPDIQWLQSVSIILFFFCNFHAQLHEQGCNHHVPKCTTSLLLRRATGPMGVHELRYQLGQVSPTPTYSNNPLQCTATFPTRRKNKRHFQWFTRPVERMGTPSNNIVIASSRTMSLLFFSPPPELFAKRSPTNPVTHCWDTPWAVYVKRPQVLACESRPLSSSRPAQGKTGGPLGVHHVSTCRMTGDFLGSNPKRNYQIIQEWSVTVKLTYAWWL